MTLSNRISKLSNIAKHDVGICYPLVKMIHNMIFEIGHFYSSNIKSVTFYYESY
jgi:hypothetical protein